jgi:hypothetical protein
VLVVVDKLVGSDRRERGAAHGDHNCEGTRPAYRHIALRYAHDDPGEQHIAEFAVS